MQKDSSYNCDGHSKLHSKTLIKALNVKKKKNCHLLTKPHPCTFILKIQLTMTVLRCVPCFVPGPCYNQRRNNKSCSGSVEWLNIVGDGVTDKVESDADETESLTAFQFDKSKWTRLSAQWEAFVNQVMKMWSLRNRLA